MIGQQLAWPCGTGWERRGSASLALLSVLRPNGRSVLLPRRLLLPVLLLSQRLSRVPPMPLRKRYKHWRTFEGALRINARWCACTFAAPCGRPCILLHKGNDMAGVEDKSLKADVFVKTTVYPPVEPEKEAPPRRQIRRSVRRLESRAKVDGSAEYIYNLRLPGMLHGKIFRSSVAHGRILNIDTSAAMAVEGVEAVITGKDVCTVIPDPYHGPAFLDQPILALEKVRHIGEPMAVVLARDPHIAEEAAGLIIAEYES